MRNRLIHGYFFVNYDIFRDTSTSDLPPRIEDLERMVAAMRSGSEEYQVS
jgi:uncharacterized protein with HEPN domain